MNLFRHCNIYSCHVCVWLPALVHPCSTRAVLRVGQQAAGTYTPGCLAMLVQQEVTATRLSEVLHSRHVAWWCSMGRASSTNSLPASCGTDSANNIK